MKIYKITDASKYLGVSSNTLKTLANNGKIKSFKTAKEGSMKFLRVGLSVGHHPDAKSGVNKMEYAQCSAMVGHIIKDAMLTGDMKPYLIGTGGLKKKVKEINKLKLDCVIEVHLNYGGGKGCETLYCPGSRRGICFADIMQSSLSNIAWANRGTRAGYYKMNRNNPPNYFLSKTNCPAIILEHYFLDNQEETARFYENPQFYAEYAKRVVRGLNNYRGNVGK